jgi:hypothetical protein
MTTWTQLLHPERDTNLFDRNPLPPFVAEATDYRPGNAYWLAELSRIVYRDLDSSDAILNRVGLQRVASFNSDATGTQAFLVRSPSFAVLAFRGSPQELKDFLSDADFRRIPIKSGTVHEGFERAIDSVWNDIAATLPTDCPIFYTGHSLGAALAILAAGRRAPQAAYVFGAPRVGDATYAASLANVKLFRIVDGSDIVTMVPPEEFGYRHAGEVHPIGTPLEAGFKFDPLEAFARLIEPPQWLADHAPIHYVERV